MYESKEVGVCLGNVRIDTKDCRADESWDFLALYSSNELNILGSYFKLHVV